MEGSYVGYLENLLKGLVDSPEEVKIEKVRDDRGILLNVRVAKKDMGLVIGQGGATIKAIRFLVGAVGTKENARVSIKLLED